MTVGFLPALGSGIRALAETGQQSRLIEHYLRPYADAFGEVLYFSYLPESLEEFTNDRALLDRVRVLAPVRPMSRGLRAVTMTRDHAAEFERCSAIRVFQITGTIPARRAKRRFKVPYVTTYGFWYAKLSQPGPKSRLKAAVEWWGLRGAAAVIATTEELRARAARVAPRVELIPNGVDVQLFRPANAPRPAGRRILYVGRLSREKNLETVVTATPSDGTLVIAGTGPLRDSLQAFAERRGTSVEFLGVVEQPKLPAIYAAADVFVLASFTEGHPKVLLEAMASGLPCVASDCPGNRSLVTDGETGLIFNPHSPGELAACLRRIFDDKALAVRLGQAAREVVVRSYDLSALVQREIALVHSVAGH